MAWETLQYYDPQTGNVAWVRLVRWAELGAAPREVRSLDRDRGLLLGAAGPWVVWLDDDHGPSVHVHDVAANVTQRLGDVELAGVSEAGLVVAKQGAAGTWSFQFQRWQDVGKAPPREAPMPGLLAVLGLLVALGRRRARGSAPAAHG